MNLKIFLLAFVAISSTCQFSMLRRPPPPPPPPGPPPRYYNVMLGKPDLDTFDAYKYLGKVYINDDKPRDNYMHSTDYEKLINELGLPYAAKARDQNIKLYGNNFCTDAWVNFDCAKYHSEGMEWNQASKKASENPHQGC